MTPVLEKGCLEYLYNFVLEKFDNQRKRFLISSLLLFKSITSESLLCLLRILGPDSGEDL